MTATPDYINFKDIDLLIKISPSNSVKKTGTIVKYLNKSTKKIIDVISSQYITNNIDVVYARDINRLDKIKNVKRNSIYKFST